MQTTALEIRRAGLADKLPLLRMLELYQYELSDIWDQDLDCHGEYGYALDRYWRDPSCQPFVALMHGHYAGFALADAGSRIAKGRHWMDQFFVLKKYRRHGVGKALALHVFASLPGYWEVGQMRGNSRAQSFWRSTIADYTQGNFQEHTLSTGPWQGSIQCFSSGALE